MTFWRLFKASYAGAFAFIIACPLLALVPVVFEMLQHIVEVHIGMYDSAAAAQAVAQDPARMTFGLLKVMALTVPGYWVTRFLAYRDPARAARMESPAVGLFALFFVAQIAIAIVQLFLLPQSSAAQLGGFAAGLVIGALLAAWGVAAPLGDRTIGPRASVAIMARQTLWTIVFSLAAIMPLMIPHYLFAAMAILGSRQLLWPVLAVDAALVGVLSPVMMAAAYHAVLRATDRAGVTIRPSGLAGDHGLTPYARHPASSRT